MKKLLGLIVAVSFLFTGCSSSTPNTESTGSTGKTLKVVTVAPYEPYETMNKDGKLEGFDIDMTEAIAKKLGYTLEWENLEFDAALLAIQNNQADLAVAGLSPTAERMKVLDFSEIYYQESSNTVTTVVTLKSRGFTSAQDLKGLKAGVQNGTIQQEALESIKDEYNLTIDTRKEYADIVQEIINGNLDFMVCEQVMAQNYLSVYPELASFPLGVGEDSNGNAIAFPKGSSLRDEFNKEILAMKESGEMQTLIDKWFKK
ncbi:MAG: transporter substrate-binding domain-containing protein [Erysipelotrichaceae bacterium]|nr:transporter substrate-binding domain-containing protein [Erysipelotrichaceae bacterium]